MSRVLPFRALVFAALTAAALPGVAGAAELTPGPVSVTARPEAEAPGWALQITGELDPSGVTKVEDRRLLVAFDLPAEGVPAGAYTLRLRLRSGTALDRVDLNFRGKSARSSNEVWHHDFELPAGGWRDVSVPVRVAASGGGARWYGAVLARLQFDHRAEGGSAIPLEVAVARIELWPASADEPLMSIALDDPGSDDAGRLRLRANAAIGGLAYAGSATDPTARAVSRLNLSVETGRVGNLWFPTDPEPPSLVLSNPGRDPVRGGLRYTLEDFDGNVSESITAVALEPGGEVRLALDRPQRLGVGWIEAAWHGGDGSKRRGWSVSYAAIDPAGPTEGITRGDDFLIGLANGARIGDSDRETRDYLDIAAFVGAKFVRMTRHWPQVEPREGEFHWEKMDQIVREATARHIEVQAVIGKSPKWAWRPQYHAVNTPGRVEPFRRYVETFAERYGGRVRLWEVFNEPDIGFYLGTLEEYVEVLAAAHDTLKSVDPDMVVMTGGFTGFVHGRRKAGFQEAILRDHQDLFDIHTLHMHGTFERFWGGIERFVVPIRDGYGVTQPIIFNETGMDGRHGMAYQAEMTVKKVAAARSIGARGYAWYAIHDHPKAAGDPFRVGRTYGLLTHEWQPKPALAAWNTTARLIGRPGSAYVGRIDLGPDRFAFVFREPGGGYVTALWAERDASSEALLAVGVGSSGGGAEVVDLMGNAEPLAVVDGVAMVRLGWTPAFLRSVGRPELRGVVLDLGVLDGVDARLSVAVDPLVADEPWRLGEAAAGVSGRGPASAELGVWAFTPPARFGAPSKPASRAAVAYAFPERGPGGILHAAVRPIQRLSGAAHAGRSADLTLGRREQVHNRFEHDPHSIELLWAGADDLSAEAWVVREAGAICLRVEVTDDVRREPFRGVEVWRGDGVALAIRASPSAEPLRLALGRDAAGRAVLLTAAGDDAWEPSALPGVTGAVAEADGRRRYDVRIPTAAVPGARSVIDRMDLDLRVNDLDAVEERWETQLALREWAGDAALGQKLRAFGFE